MNAERFIHTFTDRTDGNLAFHVGDDPLYVTQHHDLLAQKLGYKRDKLVHMRQIHSDIIHIVNDNDDFNHPPECDALITDKIGIPIMIMSADCIPIIIYDPVLHVTAVVHAGRAGAFKNIVGKTIQMMHEHFTCKAESYSTPRKTDK